LQPLVLKGLQPLVLSPCPRPGAIARIDALGAQVAWKYADGFQRWLAKYVKTDKIRTSAQASRCIEGLKGMLKNSKE